MHSSDVNHEFNRPRPVTVVVISDHPLEIVGLQTLISDAANIRFSGHTNDSADGLALCRQIKPDVVLLSLVLPGLAPTLVVRELVTTVGCGVIGICSAPDGDQLRAVIGAGARGLVQRRDPAHSFLDAVQVVASGSRYTSDGIERLFALGERDTSKPRSANAPKPLTPREREVLKLIADGETTSEIATRLSLSVKTIETHRKNVMDKLQTRSIAQLTKLAIQSGLTTIDN